MSAAPATEPSTRFDRLSSSRDVRRVLRHGRRRHGPGLAVHLLVPPEVATTPTARLAVIASSRIGNAVVRNRAKRLLREAARRVSWPSGADVVLVARTGIVGRDLWQVLDEVTGLATTLDVDPTTDHGRGPDGGQSS